MHEIQLLDKLHEMLEEQVSWHSEEDRNNMRLAVERIRDVLEDVVVEGASLFDDLKEQQSFPIRKTQ